MSTTKTEDHRFMRAALSLAQRGLGTVWPNPSVGCILVKHGHIVGRGYTQPGGRPHGETRALAMAKEAATGATAYVTLEPCSHHGKTAPCAQALIDAEVARVVIALGDPDDRVSGRGVDMLEQAGIDVSLGLLADEAADINQGYLSRISRGLPMVTLKLASSLDGRIALHNGKSQWITGPEARAAAHKIRARHDAILIGGTTALLDDPMLDCRLPGLEEQSPVRIVADGRLRLPLTSRLARTAAEIPTWVLTRKDADHLRIKAYQDCGIQIIQVECDADGNLDMTVALGLLAGEGITRLMVEGGAGVAASLIRQSLVDRIVWFRGPSVIGGDGLAAIQGLGLDEMEQIPKFTRRNIQRLGKDVLETFVLEA